MHLFGHFQFVKDGESCNFPNYVQMRMNAENEHPEILCTACGRNTLNQIHK